MTMQRTALIAGAAAFVLHAAINPHYGFFRDELYFIICGQHPQWGYVDQPPLVPLLAALTQLSGHSLLALRLIPALFSGASIYVTVLLVEAMGGGAFAGAVAALAAFFAPVLLSFGMKASTDEVGLLLWPLMALLVLRIVNGGRPQLWIGAGICCGLAFEAKYSVLFFAIALVAGLLATPQRRILFSPWFAAGAAAALLIALPNALWQLAHGLPMLELLRNGQNGKNVIAGPLLYLLQQLLITNILFTPLLIAGLWRLFRDERLRFLGFTYVVLIALMIVAHGKHYYPAAVYPIVFAAAGVALEAVRNAVARGLLAACVVAAGLVFMPFAAPVLPESQMAAYTAALQSGMHVGSAIQTEHHRESTLPSDFADMHGWPQMAALTRSVYYRLPDAQRRSAVVIASNYGQASAIEFFAPDVPVISPHNQYWLWGTRGFDGSILIEIGGDCGVSKHIYRSRENVATFDDPYAISYERNQTIGICRGPNVPLAALWPTLRDYN